MIASFDAASGGRHADQGRRHGSCHRRVPAGCWARTCWDVFVRDPFPDTEGARLAHACEVVCRSQEVAKSPLETVCRGDRVVVSGEMVIERVDGAIEDDLSAVRMWIKATSVASQ